MNIFTLSSFKTLFIYTLHVLPVFPRSLPEEIFDLNGTNLVEFSRSLFEILSGVTHLTLLVIGSNKRNALLGVLVTAFVISTVNGFVS